MKKNILVLLSIVSLFTISCSNLVENKSDKSTDLKSAYCTVRGSLSSEIDYLTSSRSAFPSNAGIDLSSYTTKIYYKETPAATQKTLCCTTTGSDFELKLPSLGTYYLEAESYNASNVIDFKTLKPVEITLTEDAPYKDDVSLFLHIVVGESGKGSIDLYMNSFDTSKVAWFNVTENETFVDNLNLQTTSSKWHLDGIGSGVHDYVFKFYDNLTPGNLVYQCTETVAIFPGKTTNTWVKNGNAEYFSTEQIDGKETVVMNITQECLDNFALTNFYVNSSGDDSGNGSYFAPVKTLKAAVAKCTDSSKNYTINIMGDVEVNSGSVVSNNITIQKAPGVTSAKLVYKSTSYALFQVSASNTLKISNIDIVGPDKQSSQSGGAAIHNSGTLILNNVNLSNFKNGSGTDKGGCLYNNENGTISITGGSITSCASNQGGAIYNAGKDIEINDCTISSCTAQTGGAIYNYSTAKITLSGDTSIINCTASSNGGGIYLGSNGAKAFLQDNVSITSCTAASGGGIYASAAMCRVYMKDSAYLDSASDIRLNANGYVSLNGDLTPPAAANGIAATLTPQFYNVDDALLDGDPRSLIAGNYKKFALKDENYFISSEGKILPYNVTLSMSDNVKEKILALPNTTKQINIDVKNVSASDLVGFEIGDRNIKLYSSSEKTLSVQGDITSSENGHLTIGENITLTMDNYHGELCKIRVESGEVTISGGTITGKGSYSSGGGMIVVSGGTFNMDSGEIVGDDYYKPSLYVTAGIVNITGGKFSGTWNTYQGGSPFCITGGSGILGMEIEANASSSIEGGTWIINGLNIHDGCLSSSGTGKNYKAFLQIKSPASITKFENNSIQKNKYDDGNNSSNTVKGVGLYIDGVNVPNDGGNTISLNSAVNIGSYTNVSGIQIYIENGGSYGDITSNVD